MRSLCAFKLVVNRGIWTTRCLSTRLAHSGFGHSHYALALETNQAMKAIPCAQTHISMCIRASHNSFQNNTNEWINKSILYIFSSEKSVRPASYVACHPTHMRYGYMRSLVCHICCEFEIVHISVWLIEPIWRCRIFSMHPLELMISV